MPVIGASSTGLGSLMEPIERLCTRGFLKIEIVQPR
jgi:hypothetical protein